MKKSVSLAVRVLAAVLAYAALLMLAPTAFAAEAGSLDNFKATETYTEGQFTDVPKAWYAASVKTAYELGLIKGVGGGQFNPTGNISIMETIVLACRIHKTYYTGDGSFVQGKPWYQVYLDYAVANGIIVKDQYPDYQAKATRAIFAQVLAKALPAEALPVINRVDDDAIPDVAASLPYAAPIYQLYRAGILTGGTDGAFSPATRIARSEAAAIAARMARPAERRSITLTVCAAKGHTWDAGTVTKAAACETAGVKTLTCTVCGETKTVEIAALGHSYGQGVTCARCGKERPLEMTAAEKTEAGKVYYILNRSRYYDDANGCYRYLFSLQDRAGNYIKAPCKVKVEIVNDDGQTVYSGIKLVHTSDFGTWTNNNSSRSYTAAAVYVYDSEITPGTDDGGKITFTVLNDGYFSFDPDKYTIYSGLPKIDLAAQCSLKLPSVPYVIREYSYYSDKLEASTTITGITYKFVEGYNGEVTLYIYYSGEKTYDYRGSGQSRNLKIGWKLYDEEGYVVDTGTHYGSSLAQGDKFKDSEGRIYNLKPGKYRLEIISTN